MIPAFLLQQLLDSKLIYPREHLTAEHPRSAVAIKLVLFYKLKKQKVIKHLKQYLIAMLDISLKLACTNY